MHARPTDITSCGRCEYRRAARRCEFSGLLFCGDGTRRCVNRAAESSASLLPKVVRQQIVQLTNIMRPRQPSRAERESETIHVQSCDYCMFARPPRWPTARPEKHFLVANLTSMEVYTGNLKLPKILQRRPKFCTWMPPN